jgi:hypothetical protein
MLVIVAFNSVKLVASPELSSGPSVGLNVNRKGGTASRVATFPGVAILVMLVIVAFNSVKLVALSELLCTTVGAVVGLRVNRNGSTS